MPRAKTPRSACQGFPGQVILTKTKPGLHYHLDGQTDVLQTLLKQPALTNPCSPPPEHPSTSASTLSESARPPGELTLDFVNYHHDLASDKLTPVTAADFQVQLQMPKLTAAPQVEVIRYDETAPHNHTRSIRCPPIRYPLQKTAYSSCGPALYPLPALPHREMRPRT